MRFIEAMKPFFFAGFAAPFFFFPPDFFFAFFAMSLSKFQQGRWIQCAQWYPILGAARTYFSRHAADSCGNG
jgi:hypothetical protein